MFFLTLSTAWHELAFFKNLLDMKSAGMEEFEHLSVWNSVPDHHLIGLKLAVYKLQPRFNIKRMRSERNLKDVLSNSIKIFGSID